MAPSLSLTLILLLSLIIPHSIADNSIGQYCANPFKGNAIQSNINTVLSDLVAKASVAGFATSSFGQSPATIYGLAQCRADVSSDDCSNCLTAAAKELPSACPAQTDARVWYDFCFMRYDNDNFIGHDDTSYAVVYYNVDDAPDAQSFVKEVSSLMSKASSLAVQPGSESLGRAKKVFSPYVTIYALAQCTRDLQPLTCAQCLSTAIGLFASDCQSKKGCQVNYSSCTARYEVYPFYFPLDSGAAASVGASFVAEKYQKKILGN